MAIIGDNEVIVSARVDTKGVEKGVQEIKRITENLEDIDVEVDDDQILEGISTRLQELHTELKELEGLHVIGDDERQRIQDIKSEITQLINEANEMTGQNYIFKGITNVDTNVTNIDDRLKSMDKSLEKVGRRVANIGLRLLGINSIYGMISSSVKRVQDDNPQFATFMQAIQNMLDVVISKLMTMIEPFLPKILPLIEKVLTLIFQIAEALDKTLGPVLNAIIDAVGWIIDGLGWLVRQILSLLGIDISSETKQFAKDISEASKGLKTTNKEVSKLRKQLLGFDEMNILNKDTGSVGALGSLGGSGKNGFKDDVDDTRDAFDKLGDKMDELGDYKFDKGFSNEFGVAGGVIKLDKAGEELVKYAKDFSVFYDTAKSITEKNGMMKIVSWTGETISIAKKDFQSLVDDMNKHVISKKNINLWKQVGKAINDINVKRFSITQKAISQGFKDAMIEFRDGLVYVKLITGETIIYTEDEFEKLKPYVKSVASSVVQTTNETTQHIKENVSGVNVAVNSAFAGIEESSGKSSDKTQKDWINVGGVVVGAFDGPSGVGGAVNGAFTGIEAQGKKTADEIIETYKNLPDELKKYVDPNWFYPQLQEQGAGVGVAVGSAITGGMVTTINGDLGVIEKSVNSALGVLRQLLNSFSAGVGGALGVAMLGISTSKIQQAKNQIKNITLPRIKLAKGGIVNRVGKGIPIGNAIAGERGREGVIPLTDSQQMALLGREIAKNVVINLTNVTELDGRQLARSVTQVMNDMSFASNGGVI